MMMIFRKETLCIAKDTEEDIIIKIVIIYLF